ncbi:MAG: SusD/RagB family nutrient-binding outer membrane lipoprotein [Dysgonamonadaceae bacterium]|nr:SusD/RagB family nutrient-binding outer membrane lipoprotein [Dysgonamonadaceae bacterium]
MILNIFKTTGTAIILCISALFASCTDNFESYNTHPTHPGAENMTVAERVGALFPGMLSLMHNFQENDNQMIEQMIGNQYGGYMATTNSWQGANFGTFNPPANWVEYPFNKLFSGFYANYLKVKEVTASKGYIFAWANIIRVAVMLRVTDTYGPIPYSKMGGGQLAVEYDNVHDIYHYMISDLTNSISDLTGFVKENSGKNNPMSEFDFIYHGDLTKWIKFANSLKLRMAVRIANVDTDYAKTVMTEAIASGVIESNADNAFLSTTDNPYRKAAFDWQDLAVSSTLSSYMLGWEDPRASVYMTSTPNTYLSYTGVNMGIKNIDKNRYGSAQYSKPNFAANSPMLVYCAAETYFLKAEAALRGWISGDAQTFYEEGIRMSMEQHGVNIGNYLNVTGNPSWYFDQGSSYFFEVYSTTNGGPVTVAWSSAGTDEQKLEAIITQKWLANYPLGFEGWCDFRRTGYPRIFPAKDNLSSESTGGKVYNPNSTNPGGAVRMARRLPYPVSEYNGNRKNVEAAVANFLGGPDEFSTNLWWAKK